MGTGYVDSELRSVGCLVAALVTRMPDLEVGILMVGGQASLRGAHNATLGADELSLFTERPGLLHFDFCYFRWSHVLLCLLHF